MKKLVVDIYKISEKEAEENFLIYKNRMKLYNYVTKEIEDVGLRDESINKYSIGQFID